MSIGLFYGGMQTSEVHNLGPAYQNDASPKNILGSVIRYNGAFWRYVKFDNGSGNVASAAGGVAHWKTLTFPSESVEGVFTVTSDYSDTIGGLNMVAGIFGGVVTDLYYTFVQISGKVTAKVADSTVAGDLCIGSGNDLIFGRIAANATVTNVVFGVALSTKNTTTGTSTVLLQGMHW
jgi:hypothetical protein